MAAMKAMPDKKVVVKKAVSPMAGMFAGLKKPKIEAEKVGGEKEVDKKPKEETPKPSSLDPLAGLKKPKIEAEVEKPKIVDDAEKEV